MGQTGHNLILEFRIFHDPRINIINIQKVPSTPGLSHNTILDATHTPVKGTISYRVQVGP